MRALQAAKSVHKKFILPMMALTVAMQTLAPSKVLAQIASIEDYNQQLPLNGIAWSSSSYFPSLYTGFAPRLEDANRIHFRLGRGNIARLTATLDEQAVLTYLYGLQKRADVTSEAIVKGDIKPVSHPQLKHYKELLQSPDIKVTETIAAFESGAVSREEFYKQSLEIMKALNPGRVFDLSFDLKAVVKSWQKNVIAVAGKDAASIANYLTRNPNEALVIANSLLFGRINATQVSSSQIAKLADLASQEPNAEKAASLIQDLSKGRYSFRVVRDGKYQQAMSSGRLTLTEFTAIYPVGSVLATSKDRDGNQIPMIREVGALNFIDGQYFDVDQVRKEGYYGWMPKMNYTGTHNAIHNPAVRINLNRSAYSGLRSKLNIEKDDKTLWLVSRSPVSHGCTRMAAGHILEVRSLFPSNPSEMTRLVYSGNKTTDYDLFDIDGSGQLKVMGSDYFVAYQLDSTTGEGYREAKGLIAESFERDGFYRQLYGQKQMTKVPGGYVFANPYMSYFAGPVGRDVRAKAFSVQMAGDYPLYEQKYEQDKLQFIDLPKLGLSSIAGKSTSARLVRLFGRVTSCGPFAAEFEKCGEAGFNAEAKSVLSK